MSETDSIVPPTGEPTLLTILKLFGERVESIELSYRAGEVHKRHKVVLKNHADCVDDSPNPLEI